ncbi:MAG: tRNA (cytidine(34)-2'-O)-methyltransferase [Sulfurospirillaceae bacterium]|jgi:tRNA (cytidine/uridine-2'-O-)-methyltransferase|nr:tRNA (cytidine(34)-2'-O)-methyltransferase [Sulfurospirillaceae bacterium]MCK9545838.1 tRNA (cytidine(34)-2'-O)-methyltransferase [Sulfurospirillaceae bacterium]MDY0237897.1 tRNA (cytidine(34)-2'-O)-methyltransferase [Campylobacterales bacterium]
MLNIVLVHPQIPQNSGSIGRMCVNIGATLHIVKPTLFNLDEKSVKRAGLDYWHLLDLKVWESLEEFLEKNSKDSARFFYATTKAKKLYFEATFKKDDFLLFGGESTGLPPFLLEKNPNQSIKIPMGKDGRSLNLATSVGIVAYEAIRQNFNHFKDELSY